MDSKAPVPMSGSENLMMDSSTFLHHLVQDMNNPGVQPQQPHQQHQQHQQQQHQQHQQQLQVQVQQQQHPQQVPPPPQQQHPQVLQQHQPQQHHQQHPQQQQLQQQPPHRPGGHAVLQQHLGHQDNRPPPMDSRMGLGMEAGQAVVPRDQSLGAAGDGVHQVCGAAGTVSPGKLPGPGMPMMQEYDPSQVAIVPRKRKFEQLELAVTQQGPAPISLSFLASKDTYCMWQILKEERNCDDSQLAATLLECYENSLRREVCSTCNSTLSRYCSKCFDLTGRQQQPYGSSVQMQPHQATIGETGQHHEAGYRVKNISEVISDGYHVAHGGDLRDNDNVDIADNGPGDRSETGKPAGAKKRKKAGGAGSQPRDPGMIRSAGDRVNDREKPSKSSEFLTKRFQCQVCDKKFANSNKLALHMIRHNTVPEVKWDSIRQYKTLHCNLCDKSFTDPDQFTAHMPKHQDEMRHQCKLCKARFFQAEVMAMHAKIHIMQPVQVHCELCNTPFATMYALRQHMRREVCQKALTQQKQGTAEEQWTTETETKKGGRGRGKQDKYSGPRVVCPQCGDSFKSKSHLSRHQLIHSGEKEFGCQECGTSCSQLSHLVAHMKSHYKLRAFECRVCHRTFIDHTGIATHACNSHIPTHLCKPPSGRRPNLANSDASCVRCIDCGMTFPSHSQPDAVAPAPVSAPAPTPVAPVPVPAPALAPAPAPVSMENAVPVGSQFQAPTQSGYELSASCFGLETVQQSLGFDSGSTPMPPNTGGPLSMPQMQVPPMPVPPMRHIPDADADLADLKTHFDEQNIPGPVQPSSRSPEMEEEYSEPENPSSDNELKEASEPADQLPASYSQLESRISQDSSSATSSQQPQQSKKNKKKKSVLDIFGEEEDVVLPFKCCQCERTFKTFQNMITHTRSHQRPVHQCPHCGKKLATAFSLANHVRTHTNEKPIKCNVCGDSFRLMTTYKEHFRIHTGEKPYLCPHCGKGFARSCNFKAHVNIHKEHKPYTCPECNKTFNHQSNLKRHSMIHSGIKPHICEVCAKCFAQPSGLAQHMRVHTGEKPYKCEDCGSCFSLYNTLVGHRRVHSGDKPFKCEICGRGFALQSNLRSHYRTHKASSKKEEQPVVNLDNQNANATANMCP